MGSRNGFKKWIQEMGSKNGFKNGFKKCALYLGIK
jgi:hypothetical protein